MKRHMKALMRSPFLLTLLSVFLFGLFAGCDENGANTEERFERTFTFEDDMEAWSGDFAEYAREMQDNMNLVFDREALPAPSTAA